MIDVFFNSLNLFDLFFGIILLYCVIQCFLKGFSLSFISFMKWVVSLIITIILVPKLQPWVAQYIESEFINNIGIGMFVFFISLFIIIVMGKSLSRVITWTGLGSIDKSFGLIFGFFKGYIVAVCLFTISNWFYPYENWGISADKALSFNVIKQGSIMLIDEFPNNEKIKNTKDKIEKI